MTKNLFRISLLILANVISTACLKAQDSDSIICLKTRQIDFLILEQVDAQFLRKDTALKAEKISSLNKIILKQADSQSKTESIVKLKDSALKDSQKAFNGLSDMFKKESSKKVIWRNTSVILGSISIILSCIIILGMN